MPTPIISVQHLSKAYRIGLKEDIPDTFVAAMTGWLKAPLRNWRRLRRLNTFGEAAAATEEVGGRRSEVGGQEEEVGGQRSEVGGRNGDINGNGHAGPPTSDLRPPSSDIAGPPTSDLRPPSSDTLWALRDVSFEVHEGEVVGIIGRNGAGKSTLLKILSRITEPTHGRAVIRGRVSSLLEVGTGFHPELTGRENIYMNGTILGMRKREIDRKFDEIVDFSGVEKFLDTPIKRYSSGMQVRLAFAVAAHLEPEILIIDEVLAVGDAEFQKKCLGKMQDVARGGRTVLIVSHNMSMMETLCTCAFALNKGQITQRGSTAAVIADYMCVAGDSAKKSMVRSRGMQPLITSVELIDEDGSPTPILRSGDDACFRLHFDSPDGLANARIGIRIDTLLGARMLHLQSELATGELLDLPETGFVDCTVPRLPLVPGHYTAAIALFSERRMLDHLEPGIEFRVDAGDFYRNGHIPSVHLGQFLSSSEWRVGNAVVSCR